MEELNLNDVSERLRGRVLGRADVVDSKLCRYDLGLQEEVPRVEDQSEAKKFLFHHGYLFEEDRPERYQSLPIRLPSDWGLERVKVDALHPNISRAWKTFLKRKEIVTQVKMLGKIIKPLLRKGFESRIRRQLR